MARSRGRPRGKPANHHLKLEGGIWIFRLVRRGGDQRISTGCPSSEVARAREIRDKLLGDFAARRHGVAVLGPEKSIGQLESLYLAAESNPYDREKGGEQEGCKRDSEGDRNCIARLYGAGLRKDMPANSLDAETILDLKKELARQDYAPLTRRNSFRLLARVYRWARAHKKKTGVIANPFEEIDTKREGIFSNQVERQAPPFTREQFRALLDSLPSYAYRPVRFGAHTGMRWESELLRMVWGRVDLDRKVYRVDPMWAKFGKKRDAPLNEAALSILRQIRPANAKPEDPVWLNAEGGAVRDLRSVFEVRVRKVCPAPEDGERYPDFHSLRRTCATALSLVTRKAVVRAVLGHADEDVTDRYVDVPLSEQLAAVNAGASFIDGEPEGKVVSLSKRRQGSKMAAAGA